jgi:hypothetical protein
MVPMQQPKVALQHPTWGDESIQLSVPKAPLCSLSLCWPKTDQAALGVVPSGWDHEAEKHHSRSHPRLLDQVQLGLHTSENDISGKFRTIREMIVSVHTGAFVAIYHSECYATTNFLDPDFWGLSKKVT